MIDIYTDGACIGNPGPGGWGAIVMTDGDVAHGRRLSGGEPRTTNNRMEMTAAIRGLEATPKGATVTVHSDSEYVVNTMTRNWKRNANQDLWPRLDALVKERKVAWRWVRGHNGHALNEEADRLAVAEAKKFMGKGRPLLDQAGPAREGDERMSTEREMTHLDEHGGAPPPSDPPSPAAPRLTHLDEHGRAAMVDVGGKPDTERVAIASGVVSMRPETLNLVLRGQMEKGDVFTVARLAGIAAAKRTWDLIPLAHQVPLSHVGVDFAPDAAGRVVITGTAHTTAKTGVEMEALAAVSVAALAIYDMCKAVDRGMTIGEVRLLEKRGGTRGDYKAPRST